MLSPKFLAASILALGLTSAPVLAQDAVRAGAEVQFQQLDKQRKGYLTQTDVSGNPAIARRFGKFDANSDGKLDPGEFASLVASMK